MERGQKVKTMEKVQKIKRDSINPKALNDKAVAVALLEKCKNKVMFLT